ncbi:hypothetical protein [Chryseobacterium sp. HR92]|uniref:hypothetical protein n=1 Tax=Chryseobacterium sp. HR92 TaxID=3094839 RepID=UPI00388D51DF|nr:hypothetical protein SFA27_19300 [Chryseobacterium sp. HR92]
MIIALTAVKDPKSIHFKPDQVFKLKDIPELKSSQNMAVYITLTQGRPKKSQPHNS